MKTKKTISVDTLRTIINDRIRHCSEIEAQELCALLETVLHQTGNYKGYNYLDWLEGGCDRWVADGKPENNKKYLGPDHKRLYF